MKTLISTLLSLCLLTTSSLYAYSDSITLEQVKADMEKLASNDMKGRGNFSPEIDLAADYIAQRFEKIGLKPPKEYANYKQPFQLFMVNPGEISVSMNGVDVIESNVLGVTKANSVTFDDTNKPTITYVGLGDDLRAALTSANSAGGNHFIVVHPTHEQLFERYKNYFASGRLMLEREAGGSLIAVLSDATEVTEINATLSMDIIETKVSNVIGVIPGKSEEQIIFSAHYDHLGTKGDQIYNGADDNASGVTAVLGLAQHFADKGPQERTLVFIGFGAEEGGILGSEYYTRTINADSVVAMINIEMVGSVSAFGLGKVWMTGSDRSNLRELLNESLSDEQKIQADPYAKFNLFYRSDNASLARLGVPAHSFSSTEIDKAAYYHQPSDDLSVINFESLLKSSQLLAKATESLANGSITPSRVEPSAVRAKGKIY